MLFSNTYLQWNMTKTTLIATQSFILFKKNMRRLNYIEIPRVVSGTSAANKAQVWLKRIKSAQQGGQGWPPSLVMSRGPCHSMASCEAKKKRGLTKLHCSNDPKRAYLDIRMKLHEAKQKS